MREHADHGLERAYRAAIDADAATAEGAAALQRRRAKVLNAIRSLPVDETPHVGRLLSGAGAAPHEARWGSSRAWWRGVAAACLVVSSAMLVEHLRDEPQVPLAPATPGPAPDQARVTPPQQENATQAPKAASGAAAVTPVRAPLAARKAPADIVRNRPVPSAAAAADAAAASSDAGAGPAQAVPAAPAAAAKAEPATASQAPAKTAAATAVSAAAPLALDAARRAEGVLVPVQGSLLAAVVHGDVAAARVILRNAHPDAERDADGRTALAIAVLRSDLPLVKLMLAAGADRSAKDRFGKSALDYAEISGDRALREVFDKP